MRQWGIVLGFLLLSVLAFAQKKKNKPNVRGSEAFIDSIPHFIYEKAELDTYLVLCAKIPAEAEEHYVNASVLLSFRVDSLGKIVDLTAVDYEIRIPGNVSFASDTAARYLKNGYKTEALRLVRATDGLWVPGRRNGKYYNGKVIMEVHFLVDRIKAAGKMANQHKMKYYYDYGVKEMNQGKYGTAILLFNEAISFNRNDKDAYYNLGVAYKKMGKTKESCAAWEKGASLGDTEQAGLVTKYCK
jgi:tetratricopeptide (TPR) repeat protein